MDRPSLLAAVDAQLRRDPPPDGPDGRIGRDEHTTWSIGGADGWNGVLWSDLDERNADPVIAAQIERFGALGFSWEWKHYGHDRPADLPDRLLAAGFTRGEPETLLVAEIADLDLDVPPPAGVELRPVTDRAGVDALVRVHDIAFGGDHSRTGRSLLAAAPGTMAGVVALAGSTPISSARIEFHHGTEFAGLWGGGTVPEWRGRGVFRALVAYRAKLAAARGFRYLQVDASADSRPILGRLGFVELAMTTPYLRSA